MGKQWELTMGIDIVKLYTSKAIRANEAVQFVVHFNYKGQYLKWKWGKKSLGIKRNIVGKLLRIFSGCPFNQALHVGCPNSNL